MYIIIFSASVHSETSLQQRSQTELQKKTQGLKKLHDGLTQKRGMNPK